MRNALTLRPFHANKKMAATWRRGGDQQRGNTPVSRAVGRSQHMPHTRSLFCNSKTFVRATGGVVSATFGNMELGDSVLGGGVHEDHVFVIWCEDGISGILIAALPPPFIPFCPLEEQIGESPDD